MSLLSHFRLGALLFAMTNTAFAQSSRTPELFDLRALCKDMADRKAEEIRELDASLGANAPQIREARTLSRYKNKHCYIELYRHEVVRSRAIERITRTLYDAYLDEMLAYTQIENGKKSGMIFDGARQPVASNNAGWDEADKFLKKMMNSNRLSH